MPDSRRKSRRTNRPTKDRVLQARIPEHLDEELRERAEQLGLSVSTIVRNTLLHTFNLVEGVVADSAQLARAAQGRGKAAAAAAPTSSAPQPVEPEGETGVIGWQEAILNRNGVCDNCNAILPAGGRAAIGIPAQARPVLLCLACLSDLSKTMATAKARPVRKTPAAKTRRKTKPGN